jgi:hypothetical protein
VEHSKLAGLQVADAVASGLHFALKVNRYRETETSSLSHLKRTIFGLWLAVVSLVPSSTTGLGPSSLRDGEAGAEPNCFACCVAMAASDSVLATSRARGWIRAS